MVSLAEAVRIVQTSLDTSNIAEGRLGTGDELIAFPSPPIDLEYGWWIAYAPRGHLEHWPGTWDLAGGCAYYVVLKSDGQVWIPKNFARADARFGPWWRWLLDFEQDGLGVIRIAGRVHPTFKYDGKPDLSFLPAFEV
jgi:hypothetical protein